MDRLSLIERFRNIITLASLAYTFTTIHTLQYSMRTHNNDTAAPNPQDNGSTASSSVHDVPAAPSTTGSVEKTGGRWMDNEVNLLLDYVEANCTLTTARGLNLKKSEFNKARNTVKTKDAAQCHYKWGHVCIHHQ